MYGASIAENMVLAGTSMEICIPIHGTVTNLSCDIRPLVADFSPWRCGFDSGPIVFTVKHMRADLSACEYGKES
jgi:hypothetical protein